MLALCSSSYREIWLKLSLAKGNNTGVVCAKVPWLHALMARLLLSPQHHLLLLCALFPVLQPPRGPSLHEQPRSHISAVAVVGLFALNTLHVTHSFSGLGLCPNIASWARSSLTTLITWLLWSSHTLIRWFHKYLVNAYYVSGIVLCVGTVNHTDRNSCHREVTFKWRESNNRWDG